MENGSFEDVFPIRNGNMPLLCRVFRKGAGAKWPRKFPGMLYESLFGGTPAKTRITHQP